jgi:signal transduction histidine kinase/CheY-like chemotaxis protein
MNKEHDMSALHLNLATHLATPAWLARVYDYVGAHTNARRYENERDRALQRIVMPLASIAWIVSFHQFLGTPISLGEIGWSIGAAGYALASATYRAALKAHPSGGVHSQYAFMALDPLIVGWALLAAPESLAWWLVLMLVIVARVGFRYGLNAMKFSLAFAWLGAAMPLLFGRFWHTQFQMTASLVLMLVCTWWLFAPLNRSLERSKTLDIEDAKLQSLQESLKAKGDFLSRVSHELRSPLQGIISALELIEERYGKDPAEAELISRIRRGATSLNAQLQDLLTLARGEIGKIELSPAPFEALELAQSVAREVRGESTAKGLKLNVQLPPEPIFVVADAGRIDQVLTNLLTNATRHTSQGSVSLTVRPYNVATQSLEFVVTDTGPGIHPDRLPLLFQPYTRFGEMTSKGEGAGLGLAVVKTVLDFLGGKVDVRSQMGGGTSFQVSIPAELLDGEAPLDQEQPGRRALVVDDRPEVLEAIASVVTQLGLECDTAALPATAANLLAARNYDIVLIDLDMPVKSGFDLACETRRGKGPNQQTRMLSISAGEPLEKRADSPFSGHLTKPITKPALQRAIDLPGPAATAKK